MKPMRVFYAGDSPVGGAANYLLGVLKFMKARVTHLPPSEKLKPSFLTPRYDVIILSDYAAAQTPLVSQKKIAGQVQKNAGLLMIGGWGSYSGPFGGWRGSLIEKLLPVTCKKSDDRVNFPGGASLVLKSTGGFLSSKIFREMPAICGLNEIVPKDQGKVLLAARKILSDGYQVRLETKTYPLLVTGRNSERRVAALATDLAPHWCGGLVDWGTKALKLPVTPKIQIQVGNYYIEFISSLVRWLAAR